jgi:hypothetical protein
LTKRVQLAGESAEVEKFLVGLERELRVDMDNDSLRLHDGAKVGGFEFPNRDSLVALFQARSLELDGFNFGAQEKGILVRVGPASYKIRSLTANAGQISITNPRGTAGNLYFELLGTITTDHTWTGSHIFVNPIEADGGVIGNLTGDAEGNHTGSFTGAVDIRGEIFLTDDGQITEAQIDPDAWIKWGIPVGGIIMWAGLIVDIPESWALCDGTNGTPNLVNRFIVGAGDAYNPGESGGSETASLIGSTEEAGDHTHALTIADHALSIAEIPAHTHGIRYGRTGTSTYSADADDGNGIIQSEPTGGGGTHTHAGSTAANAGVHSHDITIDMELVKPPYYALCYIQKIA